MLRGFVLLCALTAVAAAGGYERAAPGAAQEAQHPPHGSAAITPGAPLVGATGLAAGHASVRGTSGGAVGRHAVTAPTLDGSAPPYSRGERPRPLPFFYDLYTFRGDGGRTAVVASFAVPAGRLRREGGLSSARYRFDVAFVLADTLRRSVFRTDDSVYVSRPWPLDGDHLLHTHVEVEAAPSASTIQRVVMTDATRPGVGQLYRSSFPIPDYGGSELMVSDVALGLPGATSGWRRGDVVLALLPTSQFPESEFDVYYEIYNLPVGTPYTTEISVEPLDESGAPTEDQEPVRTFFAGESAPGPDDYVAELRRVQSALPEGYYRLTVRVTDELSERTATRTRTFRVEPWDSGATMVEALPRGSTATSGG